MNNSEVAVKRLDQAIQEFEAACGRDPKCKDLIAALAPVRDEISEYGGESSGPSPGRKAALRAAEGGPTTFAGARDATAAGTR